MNATNPENNLDKKPQLEGEKNLSNVIDQTSELEKQVIVDGKLDQKEFDPTKNKLAKDFPKLLPQAKGETTKANPILKKHRESGEIEAALEQANQAQEAGKEALAKNTANTKAELGKVLDPSISPTVDTVKTENEKPKEGLKAKILDKETVASIDAPEQYAVG